NPHYLYSPNASIMKAGCFAELAAHFGIHQLSPNSHLFVSDNQVEDFPGRIFHIDAVTTMNKHDLRQHLQGLTQANIAVRNFPLSVAELRKRLKLSEGGSTYIFATTLADGKKVLLICSRG
ncbi:MAG: SAM-dependent methyltransferase, partial [Bacteroidales bacterium]|nr:SAM-dependent methyltransferase [Bacteroidales bacterium]